MNFGLNEAIPTVSFLTTGNIFGVSLWIQVLESHNLEPIELQTKEGLAMINGTQLITSLGADAVERAGNIARQADVVAALTLEVLKGTSAAFDSGKSPYIF